MKSSTLSPLQPQQQPKKATTQQRNSRQAPSLSTNMPTTESSSTTRARAPRSRSHSPSRTHLESASKPLRRGRKPGHTTKRIAKPSTPDFDNSFNSSFGNLNNSTGHIPDESLDFLTKSPAGHQWRHKKLNQTNIGATQRRYEEYSGRRSLVATPQGMERELRRKDIRDALMASMSDMGVPDL